MTIGGQIRINQDWGIVVVYKCASSSLKQGYRAALYPFTPPGAPQMAKNAIVVVRNPLKRVISWYRNQVRDKQFISENHRERLGLDREEKDINTVIQAVIDCPDELRDPHYRSYEAYLEGLENVRLVALERLSDTWPHPVPLHIKAGVNKTHGDYEEVSPEVEKAFEREFAEDFRIWRRACRGGTCQSQERPVREGRAGRAGTTEGE